jgi:single-stranded-DNA-specific exonuclease
MPFRWVFNQPDDPSVVSRLREELNVPETIAQLLALRRITTFDRAKSFFRPDLSLLHDPFLMKDMQKAADRLAGAIRRSEKVLVYGDYDVDGTTATSIMYTYLKDFGIDAEYYIPHRFKEGYGISEEGIEHASAIGAKLIVTVDCGITAVEEARWARDRGIDMIICDHHNAGPEIPQAVAVLDPKQPDCTYPFDGLSGAGVGFKLVQATNQVLGLPEEKCHRFLDLLAISIASDIVPIVDENRILMREGLQLLNTNPRLGLKALMNEVKLNKSRITTSEIVFTIGPRINAAGRMGDAMTAVELLIADNDHDAVQKAQELESINVRRRAVDNETMEQAVQMVDQHYSLDDLSSLVLHHPEWHLGVIGIVASRLVDKYYRPAIMLSTVDGLIKGSARSIKGFNVYNALRQCDDLLMQFGGHEFAAGLTLEEKHLESFRTRFNTIVDTYFNESDFEPEINIDALLDLHEVDSRFWKLLTQFEPFGPENTKPVFASRNLRVVGNPSVVGNGHLKLRVAQNGSSPFDAIGFNMHEHLPRIRQAADGGLHLAYMIEENTWNNKTTLQMRIKDIQFD